MKRLFVIWTSLTLGCLIFSRVDAVQVVEMHPAQSWGEAAGQGFEQGLNSAREDAREQRRFQEALEADLISQAVKEESNNRQAVARASEQDQNNRILQSLLQGYTPEKNSEYVLKILKSQLPMQMKKDTIAILNEQSELSSRGTKE